MIPRFAAGGLRPALVDRRSTAFDRSTHRSSRGLLRSVRQFEFL